MARNISTHLAFAATVAVMGLGGISSTQAAVIYTAGSNLYVSGQNHVNLDGLSGNDIRVTSQAANYYNIGSDGSGGQWATDITGGPPTNYTRAPLKFNFGDTVGAAGQLFVGPDNNQDLITYTDATRVAHFTGFDDGAGVVGSAPTAGSTLYLGVKFNLNGNVATPVYGWIGFVLKQVDATAGVLEASAITGYAYESSGGTILVGATPEPASLSLLAIGAMGALRRRRLATA